MPITDQDIYGELGQNFRLTLRWRQGLFAGFLAILGALAVAFNHLWNKQKLGLASIVLLSASLLAIVFWLLDRRCHEVLIDNYQLGKSVEGRANLEGYYAEAQKRGLSPKRITHTFVLDFVYKAMALLLVSAFIFISLFALQGGFKMSEKDQVVVLIGFYSLLKLLAGLITIYLGYKLIITLQGTGVMELQRKKFWAGVACGVFGGGLLIWAFFQGVKPGLTDAHDARIKKAASKMLRGENLNEEEKVLVRLWVEGESGGK